MSAKRKDYSGVKVNRLTAVKCSNEKDSSGKLLWIFKCECGDELSARPQSVISGTTKSCGCLRQELLENNKRYCTHGFTNSRFYSIWKCMKWRCKYHKRYKFVSMCTEWKNFPKFKEDMYESYEKAYKKDPTISIDRIDNEKGYSKENCRWVNQQEQMNNQSRNRIIEYNGKKQTLAQWSREYGLNPKTLHQRLDNGLSIHDALTTPIRSRSERWYKL